MKAGSEASCSMASAGLRPCSLVARYSGVSRMKLCTSSSVAFQPPCWLQATGDGLQLATLARDGLVGHRLQARIEGRAHDEAVCVEAVVVAVGPVDEPLPELLGEVGVRGQVARLALEIEPDRFFS